MRKGQVSVSCFVQILIWIVLSPQSLSAQLVLDGANINISGGTSTASVTVVVDQSNTAGITRLAGGHIYTEGQYNFVVWNAGTTTGEFVFPFGVAGTAADYIPFTFDKTSVGATTVTASTWNTNQQNVVHPGVSDVAACYIMTGYGDSVTTALDRFWDIRTLGSATANVTFSYRGSENTIATPTVQLSSQRWTGTDWAPPVGPGTAGVTLGIGTVAVTGLTVFTPFVLVDRSLPMMNAAYAIPKKKLDGGYYSTLGNRLYFMYEGEYAAGTLQYKIFDESRTLVTTTSINTTTRNFGDNRYVLNCSSLTTGYYVMEITNEKNEILKLRFKKP